MNRIGLHIIGGTSLALAGAGRPRIVKLCDCSPEYKAQVRAQVGPDCLIVVRWVESAQPLTAPEAEAEAWFARHEAQMRRMADGDGQVIFEGYNEVSDDMAPQFARFETRRLALMHAAGLRCGVGSWSVGVPDLTTWQLYRPALAAMNAGDVLCLHEYWADGSDIGNHWLTARFAHPSVAPYLVGKQIAVTECGRDHVSGRGAAGWQRTCDAVTYLDELRAYDALLAQYPAVIGATVFTVGGSGWEAFDPSPVWPRVVSQYQAAPATVPSEEEPMSLGPDPSVSYYHSARSGYAPDWLILHDTEGSAAAALAWWRDPANSGRSSAHWLVRTDGEVVGVVPERYAAHHAGGGVWPGIPAGSVGGTSIINLVSIGIELEYPRAPVTPAWPAVQLDAAVALVRGIIQRYHIPREHVLRHADVSPTTRSDPRAFYWAGFIARAYGQSTPVAEGLPQNEPDGPPAFLAEKLRWWTEELTRVIEAGNQARTAAILDGLISLDYGLMYRLERKLKAAA